MEIVILCQYTVLILVLLDNVGLVQGLRSYKAWTTKHWCDSVKAPHWPFAYSLTNRGYEDKGRTVSMYQHLGHIVDRRGTKAKSYICEPIACGATAPFNTCNLQIQGIDINNLPTNIPTISDVAFAVGGVHRYDFGRADGHCVLLSQKHTLPTETDYSDASIRCWGFDQAGGKAQKAAATQTTNAVRNYFNPNVTCPANETGTLACGGGLGAGDPVAVQWNFGFTTSAQGVVGTLAGGPSSTAFNHASAIAMDANDGVYVADTKNHCIKYVSSSGTIRTIAGTCGTANAGFVEGAGGNAKFSSPNGIAMYYDSGTSKPYVVISDTDNHRIRLLIPDGTDPNTATFTSSTLSGLDGTAPTQGFADGDKHETLFHSPRGLAVDPSGNVYVADSLNYLIRHIYPNGTTRTVAGTLITDNDPAPSCLSPCKKGKQGFQDGSLTTAEFFKPVDVAVDGNSVIVADHHRIRRFDIPEWISGTASSNRVITIAGQITSGKRDGIGQEAEFMEPTGVTVAADKVIYVSDSADSRIRRIRTADMVARDITCSDTGHSIIIPSGCSSYQEPNDALDMMGTPVRGHVYFNYKQNLTSYDVISPDVVGMERGRRLKNCLGFPPQRVGKSSNFSTLGPYAGTGVTDRDMKEQTDDETQIKVKCPANCFTGGVNAPDLLIGSGDYYSDYSSICAAAIHSGIITSAAGGIIAVHFGEAPATVGAYTGATSNGLTSLSANLGTVNYTPRSFRVGYYSNTLVQVETVAGFPSAPQKPGKGFVNTHPPLYSKFDGPVNLDLYYTKSLSDSQKLYIADANNNAIRTMTATCQMVCENGGLCKSAETCQCATGWTGVDCTIPVCTGTPPANKICTSPNTFTCKPGYTGTNCDQALCVQMCENGGSCSSPDTCTCATGWFDPNCTTPVCSQTCGNGGNCTRPNFCACPSDWQGNDCRTPVCEQTCQNGGVCVAPNTCRCEPDWSGFDCSKPVCDQGSFTYFTDADSLSHSSLELKTFSETGSQNIQVWRTYVPCGYDDWCDSVNEFDCAQGKRYTDYAPISLDRTKSGRKTIDRYPTSKPNRSECVMIELDVNVFKDKVPFELLFSNGTISSYWRKTPDYPYEYSVASNPWSTMPFVSESDRFIALVELRYVTQGQYVCANGGACTAPYTCVCDAGNWMGFDCRIPICGQGYITSNFRNRLDSTKSFVLPDSQIYHPDGMGAKWEQRYPGQSSYVCSVRAVTEWESPNTMTAHPNFFSRYQDGKKEFLDYVGYPQYLDIFDPGQATPNIIRTLSHVNFWEGMGFSNTHLLDSILLDNTKYGFERFGVWTRSSVSDQQNQWNLGECRVEYSRTCGHREKQLISMLSTCDGSLSTCVKVSGYFKVQFGGENSDPIYVSDSAETVKAKLQGLRHIAFVDVQKVNVSNIQGNKYQCLANSTCIGDGYAFIVDFRSTFNDQPSMKVAVERNGVYESFGKVGFACDDDQKVVCSLTGGSIAHPARVGQVVLQNGSYITEKSVDVRNFRAGHYVLDTDDAYRARVTYDNKKTYAVGRWKEDGVQCIDFVRRGCYNNGTCSAPGKCVCAQGWTGDDCTTPICSKPCKNHGKCTLPETCTCEKGWAGPTCEVALCAQECNNGGKCVKPDQCECKQTPNQFRNIEQGGGLPLYRDPDGNAQMTGWTGYDCTTPICVQAPSYGSVKIISEILQDGSQRMNEFRLGFVKNSASGDQRSGGREEIIYGDPPKNNVRRCESVDQDIAGYICTKNDVNTNNPKLSKDVYDPQMQPYRSYTTPKNELAPYVDFQYATESILDIEKGSILRNDGMSFQSGCDAKDIRHANFLHPFQENYRPFGRQSGSHLCRIMSWEEGDYKDDVDPKVTTQQSLDANGLTEWIKNPTAGYRNSKAYETVGRAKRINFDNFAVCTEVDQLIGINRCTAADVRNQKVYEATRVAGEGIFVCYNRGSCVGPDNCTCPDGFDGVDCSNPICRHRQPDPPMGSGQVKGCLNGGVCVDKDNCKCLRTPSILPTVHPFTLAHPIDDSLNQYTKARLCPDAPADATCIDETLPVPSNVTGWIGTDCSIPVCSQGWYEPNHALCEGVTYGGEGCYKCSNGGNCTAPDYCTCPPEWTGFDCRTPVCTEVATQEIITDLLTVDVMKIQDFELDPCGQNKLEKAPLEWGKYMTGRGNCTKPDFCTCLCREDNPFILPWDDPLKRALPPGNTLGAISLGCTDGWQGTWRIKPDAPPPDPDEFEPDAKFNAVRHKFVSCHLKIYVAGFFEVYTVLLLALTVLSFLSLCITYVVMRRELKKREMLAKAERRRSRKSSERLSRLSMDSRDSRRSSDNRRSSAGRSRRKSSGRKKKKSSRR